MPRILVIEDEEAILRIMADALASEGYEVRLARDGRVALEILDAWRADAILLDLMMPGMNGRDFRAGQIAHGLGDIPVIVVSGARDADLIGEDLGAVATISKPFDLDLVIETVQRTVGLRQLSS